MTKAEARNVFRKKRLELSDQERDRLEDLMLIAFQSLDEPVPDRIMSFAPMAEQHEYDPHLVMEYCRFRNPAVQFFYPVVEGDQMHAGLISEDQAFVKNQFGILEPAQAVIENPQRIDMIFVPLLALDKSGRRVGFGKGFYDRFLARCRKETITIGFSFFEPVEQISNWEPHDVALHIGITPTGATYFNQEDV